MFGLATNAKPLMYDAAQPFKLTGWIIGGCMGYLEGFRMELPDECISACDYYLSGVNAHFHRKCFIDTRFAVFCKDGTFTTTGGTADIRTMETEREDYLLLKEAFGEAIQRKTSTANRKSLQNPYERTLRIPY